MPNRRRRTLPKRGQVATQRVIVIGSGFGGLAAAIRLAARGHDVTLLEKRDQPGGRAYIYRQDGFTFDGGPTVITAPWLITELFTLARRRAEDYLTLVPIDPFYRVFFPDGTHFDYSGDEQRMRTEILRLGADEADVERYLEREWGVWYALGGTGAIVDAMARLLGELGANLRLNAEVGQILVDGDRVSGVRLTNGEELPADIVVCNADVAGAYAGLLPPSARPSYSDRKIARLRYSMSLVVIYFGTDRQYRGGDGPE